MRVLLGVVLVLGTVWCGYWFVGSTALKRGAEAWFAGQDGAGGPVARRDALVVRGFPNRFDLTVTGLTVSDPVSGWSWAAPFVQVFTMTWKPWHIIAALPPEQVVTLPDQVVTVTAGRLMGSLVLHPGAALALNRVVGDGVALRVASSAGWTLAVADVDFATEQDASRLHSHRIGLTLADLAPDATLTAALATTTDLPGVIGRVHLDGFLLLSAALDRHAGETRPELTGLDLREASLDWGALKVFAKGSVATTSDGLAAGQIDIEVTGWQRLPAVMAALGLVKPEVAPTVGNLLDAMAKSGGNPDVLTLPLTFRDGWMSLGPLPLGPAPRLAQRQ